MDAWYKICQMLGRVILWFWRIKVEGELPKIGPLIIIANHHSFFDPPLLGIKLKRRLWFLAKAEVLKWKFIGPLIAKFDWALPVSKGSLLSLRKAAQLLKQGKAIVIFPGGTRTYGALNLLRLELKKGFTWLAFATKSPILPVAIIGTQRAFPRGRWLPRPAKIKIRIGKPIPIKENDEKENLIEAAMKEVSNLLSQG